MPRTRLSLTTLESRVTPASLPENFALSVLTTGLNQPTALVEAPDGRLIVTEQGGAIRIVTPGGELLEEPALELAVDTFVERGLLGVTLDPQFTENNYLYVYYTVPETPTVAVHNRLSRFTLAGDTINPESEFILVDLDPVVSGAHNGGALHFGTDGLLFVAVGDNVATGQSQSLTSYFGKILRYNADGTIPPNPITFNAIPGQTEGKYRAIFAVGFRNPFTFAVNDATGRIFVNDVGQNTFEEVNDLAPHRNYGWPATEGDFPPAAFPDFTRPLIAYSHGLGNDSGFAVTGGTFYTPADATFPDAYVGDYFYADYINNWIRVYDAATNTSTLFASELPNLRVLDLDVNRFGNLLLLDRGLNGNPGEGAIYAIRFTGLPQIADQPDGAIVRPGEAATFSVEASGTPPLTYQWQRDGEDIPNATEPTFTLADPQLADTGAVFTVVITNSSGSTTSDPAVLTVTLDQPPVPTIFTPILGTTFAAGQLISFSGQAIDPEDGKLAAAAFSWRVDYFTGLSSARPLLPETAGITSGTVAIPTSSPYTLPDVFYRVTLTVTDTFGNARSVSRDLLPQTSTVTLTSNFTEAAFTLDGIPHAAPHSFIGVVGLDREVAAVDTITVDGEPYVFARWEDGVTNRVRTISTPTGGGQFESVYIPQPPPLPPPPQLPPPQLPPPLPPPPLIAIGNQTAPVVRAINAVTGEETQRFDLTRAGTDPVFTGQTRVARADVTGDGVVDVIVGSGPGSASLVVLYDGATQQVLRTITPFESTFTGGVFVAGGDIDGDGVAEVIVSPDEGGGPRVRVFRNGDPAQVLADFFGIDDPNFRGGARVSVGDVSGDGRADLVVAAGVGGGPRVSVYDGSSVANNAPVTLFNDFFAFEQSLRNGVYIAVGDIDGDGLGDLIAGGGPGGGPRVVAFSGGELMRTGQPLMIANFFAGDLQSRNGVRVGVTDVDFDGRADVVAGSAGDTPGQVQVYRAVDITAAGTPVPAKVFNAFDDDFTGGVFVG